MPDVKEQVNDVGLELSVRGISYEYIEGLDRPAIGMAFGGGDYSYDEVSITVAFDDDGESAELVSSAIAHCPDDRSQKMMLILNRCNLEYRWAKFYLDAEGDIVADTDVVFGENDAGFTVAEAVLLMASVIDDAYRDIMKGIWG